MLIFVGSLNPLASSTSVLIADVVGVAWTTRTSPLSSRKRMYWPLPAWPAMFENVLPLTFAQRSGKGPGVPAGLTWFSWSAIPRLPMLRMTLFVIVRLVVLPPVTAPPSPMFALMPGNDATSWMVLPLMSMVTGAAPSFWMLIPFPRPEPDPATPSVPIVLFSILPFTVRSKGGFPFWKLLIATAREPTKVLSWILNVSVVLIGSLDTSTPALLFVNVAPETFTVCDVP